MNVNNLTVIADDCLEKNFKISNSKLGWSKALSSVGEWDKAIDVKNNTHRGDLFYKGATHKNKFLKNRSILRSILFTCPFEKMWAQIEKNEAQFEPIALVPGEIMLIKYKEGQKPQNITLPLKCLLRILASKDPLKIQKYFFCGKLMPRLYFDALSTLANLSFLETMEQSTGAVYLIGGPTFSAFEKITILNRSDIDANEVPNWISVLKNGPAEYSLHTRNLDFINIGSDIDAFFLKMFEKVTKELNRKILNALSNNRKALYPYTKFEYDLVCNHDRQEAFLRNSQPVEELFLDTFSSSYSHQAFENMDRVRKNVRFAREYKIQELVKEFSESTPYKKR